MESCCPLNRWSIYSHPFPTLSLPILSHMAYIHCTHILLLPQMVHVKICTFTDKRPSHLLALGQGHTQPAGSHRHLPLSMAFSAHLSSPQLPSRGVIHQVASTNHLTKAVRKGVVRAELSAARHGTMQKSPLSSLSIWQRSGLSYPVCLFLLCRHSRQRPLQLSHTLSGGL